MRGGWDEGCLEEPETKDGMFGRGGVTFHASAGKSARFGPATGGDTGKNFSRADIYYLAQPGGGEFSVSVNGESNQEISTDGVAAKSAFREIKAARPGANTFEIKTVSR